MQLKMVILKRSSGLSYISSTHWFKFHIIVQKVSYFIPKQCKIQRSFWEEGNKNNSQGSASSSFSKHIWLTYACVFQREDASVVVLKITTKNYGRKKVECEQHNLWLWSGHPGFSNSLVAWIKIHQLWYLSKSPANFWAWKPQKTSLQCRRKRSSIDLSNLWSKFSK